MRTVDVIIPTWDGRHLLGDCLKALDDQERRPDGIMVVDNGSSDGTASWLAETRPEVRVVRLEANEGFAGAVQTGIERSRAAIVAVLNNDARPQSGWLAAATEVVDERAVASCASVIITPEGRVESAGVELTIWGVGRRHREGASLGTLPTDPVEVFGPSGGAACYRRDALLAVGGFDRSFFAQDEDIDLAFRLRGAGYRCMLHPRAVVVHLGGQTLARDPERMLWLAQRNLEWAFWLNTPWWSWPVVGLAHGAYQGISLLRHVGAGRGPTVLRAKREAFRTLRSMAERRGRPRGFARRILPWLVIGERRMPRRPG